MSAPDRAAYIKGLHALADLLEEHGEVPLPYQGSDCEISINHFLGSDNPRAELAAAARAFPCDWRKGVREDAQYGDYFDLHGELHGLKIKLTAFRDAVCERVVTGTEDREVEEEIEPAKTRKVVKQVETVKWICHPVLSPAEQAEGGAQS